MKMNTDNGDWLSAQQAVQPDGTETGNLPLVNKKLPPLTRNAPPVAAPALPRSAAQCRSAIDFAIDGAGSDGLVFLELWRSGAWNEIALSFPAFGEAALR